MNGDGEIIFDDCIFLGSLIFDFIGGLIFNVFYKNWILGIYFYIFIGNEIWN